MFALSRPLEGPSLINIDIAFICLVQGSGSSESPIILLI